MKKILVASYDMEVGGVERSLVALLNNFNYEKYSVDLMLYRHQGDFLNLVHNKVNLLDEVKQYSSFRKSIGQTIKDKQFGIAISRLLSKVNSNFLGKLKKIKEPGYYQMQLMWLYALPFLPKEEKEYDVAISYLWPHYYVSEKVKAKKKIAWIHTDYSTVETNISVDLKLWRKFDHIIAVSEACKHAFLTKYSSLKDKVVVIENITSPDFIRKMAIEPVNNPMLKDNRFKIVTVARFSHAKGIDYAVKALKIMKEKGYNDISWYVVGYGGDESLIEDLIKEFKLEDSFILLGKKSNPYPYIRVADLYVQPSRYEGKAVTVGEAQILNKPVVITNYSTAPSQVKDGIDGYITDLSINGIVDGIEKLYKDENLRESLMRNCQNTNYYNQFELNKLYKFF
ncbi:glycosyltransferase [Bacillus sp. V2I10]|uniref:glycosyltransferase n=1 Tax=Bacillus sp. V2I10 TaxID=3042276 RepID=UPI00277F83A7|nr:glycosyltransferase [Bacillus sp. V2I10]MDQ0859287.1 glycosyltransferase involved in cell wall biosynthesis [Bacillus sp. V2I10]